MISNKEFKRLCEIDDKMLIIVFECNDIWRIKYFE